MMARSPKSLIVVARGAAGSRSRHISKPLVLSTDDGRQEMDSASYRTTKNPISNCTYATAVDHIGVQKPGVSCYQCVGTCSTCRLLSF